MNAPEPQASAALSADVPAPPRAALRRVLIAAAVLAALCALVWLTPLRHHAEPARLLAAARDFRESPFAPVLVVIAFGLLSSLMFPVNGLIAATGLAFGPWVGGTYAIVGVLIAAALQFIAGARLGRDAVARLAGERAQRLRGHMQRRGMWAMAVIHVLPIAPFGIMNLLAGASGVKFRDFFLGTTLAMVPAVLLVAGLGGQLARLL